MEQSVQLNYTTLLIVGLIVGVIFGLAPLITGFVKKRVLLGVIGFATCVVLGLLLGIILALPAAIIFTIIIILKKSESTETMQNPTEPPTFSS